MAITNPVATLTPEDSLRGVEVHTKRVLLKANPATIPAFTPLKRDSADGYTCIPATAIGDKIVGLTVPLMPGSGHTGLVPIPISATDQWVEVYTEVDVAADAVNFDNIAAAVDQSTKDAVFDSTGITLHFDALGF